MTRAEAVARQREILARTGDLDWSQVRPDFEIRDPELLDSDVHRGRDGWERWRRDWRAAWEDYSLELLEEIEVDADRVITVHRLRARGRASGVELERVDAQLWTFTGDKLARMDYIPDYHSSAERQACGR